MDLDEREIYFSKNGKEFPVAFRIRPDVANSAFFPAIVIKVSHFTFCNVLKIIIFRFNLTRRMDKLAISTLYFIMFSF